MHVVIIGNGITGITTARWIRKLSDFRITVISSETDHFYSRTALMYIYMGQLTYNDTKGYEDGFWEKNRINLVRDHVESILPEEKKLLLKNGGAVNFDYLVIATGSYSKIPPFRGNDLEGVQGLYSIQDLENMETHTRSARHAVVAGGGLIGIEMAEMLRSRDIPVTFLVRENSYWDRIFPPEESAMVNREIMGHGVDLKLNTTIREVRGGKDGKAETVITSSGDEIKSGFVGIATGVKPNIKLARDSGIATGEGILVDNYLRTDKPGIFAGGDCAQLREPSPGRLPIEPVWYTGRKMGKIIAHNICGREKEYNPGIWYNSARFFTIDYQVYGTLKPAYGEDESLFWQHPSGKKSIRLIFNKETKIIKGFVLMGIHYRHRLCENWISNKFTIEAVLENLHLLNCDPEFHERYEEKVIALYNLSNPGKKIRPKKKKGLFSLFT